jgi:hypothetical protein
MLSRGASRGDPEVGLGLGEWRTSVQYANIEGEASRA